MDGLSFRLADEKNLHSEITHMSWNPEHDIIVVCHANGEVVAYQAYIRKIWGLGTKGRKQKVTGIAWRPDGQVLAVSFGNRNLVLASVQDGYTLCSESLSFDVKSCCWVERSSDDAGQLKSPSADLAHLNITIYKYLPILIDLPSINRPRKFIVDPPDDLFCLAKQTKLNILILLGQNEILLRAFGLWPLLFINRSTLFVDQCLFVTMSPLLDRLCILSTTKSTSDTSISQLHYSTFDCTSFLSDYHQDYLELTRSLCRIKSLLLFGEKIYQTLIDLVTKCFIEFDKKVQTFCDETKEILLQSAPQQQWTFQSELMSLLATGNCSENMSNGFFTNIYDYGYSKKLITTFEECRTKSKELLILFGRTIEHIFGYLTEIKGLRQWHGRYEQIDFDPQLITGTIMTFIVNVTM
ncbi:unnamed protein product [Didymodactylos carnosus]|uniref:Anaphase-promoting complex subunit 4 n=1 Tax=Didymodactylos carnosus TaxID=1234261 RepID=A0A8S2SDB6_9BILA|nr:unnamed protein product [Didymodactylos carnosus]CAF4214511.1 unnamed protein product [Didymodactylos carnosus]